MAEKTAGNLLATAKAALEVLREGLIIFVVLFIVIAPVRAANYLRGLGLDKLPTPIGDFDLSKMGQAASAVDGAQRDVSDAAEALQALSAKLPPQERQKFDAVVSHLSSTAAQLKAPNQVLATAVQSNAGAKPAAPDREGWIYLGHADEEKKTWQPAPTIVQTPSPVFKPGELLTVTDDVYLRQDTGGPQRNLAPVIGVVRAGQQVKVEDVGYTHALRGGWFVWLRVSANGAGAGA